MVSKAAQTSQLVNEFVVVNNFSGSNFTEKFQAALDSLTSGGVIYVKPGSYTATENASNGWCIRNTNDNVTIIAYGVTITCTETTVQIFRSFNADNFACYGMKCVGPASDGTDLAFGLFQVDGGTGVRLTDVETSGSDADGIAVANATDVWLTGCKSNNDSKVGVYVNGCTNVHVDKPIVKSFGGHTATGNIVGAGVQLSSNTNATLTDPIINTGIGEGILINALAAGSKPFMTKVKGGIIRNVSNPTNTSQEGGVVCKNSNADKATATTIEGVTCYQVANNDFYYSGHEGLTEKDNTSIECAKSAMTIDGDNVHSVDFRAINGNTSNTASTFDINIVNTATGALIQNPILEDLSSYTTGYATHQVNDTSSGSNRVEYPEVIFTTTWDPASIAANASTSTTIASTALAFDVDWSVVPPYNLNGCFAQAYTTTSGTVKIEIYNVSGATRDLASGTWAVIGRRRQQS